MGSVVKVTLEVLTRDIKTRIRPYNANSIVRDVFNSKSGALATTAGSIASRVDETLKKIPASLPDLKRDLKEIRDFYLAIEARGGKIRKGWFGGSGHKFNSMPIKKPFLDLEAKYG